MYSISIDSWTVGMKVFERDGALQTSSSISFIQANNGSRIQPQIKCQFSNSPKQNKLLS